MKKVFTGILICLILCVTVSMAGCSNAFAKSEYNDVGKIVQTEDHFSKVNAVFNSINGNCSFTASKFDGRETLWNKTFNESSEAEIQLDLSISSGYAKIVYIDSDNNLTVLVECTQDSATEQSVTETVSLTSGRNRIKLVGYDCKDVDLKILFN